MGRRGGAHCRLSPSPAWFPLTTPPLPVYLVHWNAPEWCASAARSVLASSGVDVEVTVIDNGQTKPPALDQVLPPSVRVLRSPTNVGFAGAANLALSDWRSGPLASDLCVIASHDLQVEAFSLADLVAAADDHPEFGVIAPAVVGPAVFGGGGWNGWHAVRAPLEPIDEGLVARPWVAGTCMMLRRECADNPAVGGFDDRLGSYLEDVDLCLRAGGAGWAVGYVASSRVRGIGAASADVSYWTDRNTILVAAKHGGLPAMARALGWVAGSAAVTFVKGFVPWRTLEERTASRRWSGLHRQALRHTLGQPALLRSLLNERAARSKGPPRRNPGSTGGTGTLT